LLAVLRRGQEGLTAGQANEEIMSDSTPPRRDPTKTQLADPFNSEDQRKAARKVRCRFAKDSESAGEFTDEMSCLLRVRLRLAILIILSAFTLHFLRSMLLPSMTTEQQPFWLGVSVCEIVIMGLVSMLLWSRRPLSKLALRVVELTIFGAVAAYLGGMQVDSYHSGAVINMVRPGHEAGVLRLVGISSVLRWCLLIILYGISIPNTGRRCATVVCILAAIPVALMTIGSVTDQVSGPYILKAIPEAVIVLATAVAIAVFGSYKIRELHQQAHEAQRVGQYRLKKVIGFGGMGAVYLAEHVMLRRPCAIKLIRADQAGDPRTLVRFEREVRATATLTHWNTVEIFDYGHTEDGTFYYVMEYLPGMNLEDIVAQHGPMPPERAVHLLRQVCYALREAHGIGLLHRDIKPGNIFACERGKVYDVAKLLDFGLVKSIKLGGDAVKLTQDGAFTGSPAFMSPEQAAGNHDLDVRSDIYNVGAVGYYLVTGELLFNRSSPLQMLHAHAYEPLVPLRQFHDQVPKDLQQVILRCLEKDPSRRFPDVVAVEKALAACESAGHWSLEQAEEWWRTHEADGTAAAPVTDEADHDGRTVRFLSPQT
jgi:serine/threonine-protein kinase